MTDYNKLAIMYFEGTISAGEESILYSWMKSDEANRELFHKWEEEWKASLEGTFSADWMKMRGRLAAREVIGLGDIRLQRRRFPLWPVLAAAAMMIIALIIFIRPTEPQLYAMEAPAGERCRVVLPDSTIVWLNSCSKILIQDSFNKKQRNVTLEGEGFFDVAHNPEKPFRVSCGEASVLVKGTKFNVSAYPEDGRIITSVVEGHVVFSHGPAHIDLYKGQSAHFDVVSKAFAMSSESPESISAWRDSWFIYDGINLKELAEKLSRAYAVTFHFNTTEHLNDKFNISLRNNETLGDVLSALEKIIPVRTRIEDTNVYIDKR